MDLRRSSYVLDRFFVLEGLVELCCHSILKPADCEPMRQQLEMDRRFPHVQTQRIMSLVSSMRVWFYLQRIEESAFSLSGLLLIVSRPNGSSLGSAHLHQLESFTSPPVTSVSVIPTDLLNS
jgi:hypothetical protein